MRVLLHYVGNATYDESLFKAEARKYGANRALPRSLALKLRPGDIVLLAFKVKTGARVFGYMIVEGYTVPTHVAEQVGGECHETYVAEHRGCGTIIITKVCKVDDWTKVVEAVKKCDTKVFVYGRFRELEPFIIPVKFTMSGQWLDLDSDLPREAVMPIVRAYNDMMYTRRSYTPSHLRRRLLTMHSASGGLARWFGDRQAGQNK